MICYSGFHCSQKTALEPNYFFDCKVMKRLTLIDVFGEGTTLTLTPKKQKKQKKQKKTYLTLVLESYVEIRIQFMDYYSQTENILTIHLHVESSARNKCSRANSLVCTTSLAET
jgi:hypothetical protein